MPKSISNWLEFYENHHMATKRSNKRLSAGSATTQTLLDFDLSESSDDSDFRIEDHDDESDCSLNSNDDEQSENDDDSDDEDSDNEQSESDSSATAAAANNRFGGGDLKQNRTTTKSDNVSSANKLLEQHGIAKDVFERTHAKILAKSICCACLGDRSDDTNEIVECDNCGISVHEGCYGISDSNSVSSTVSSCSTEPWFCEACKANIKDPSCELCPNKGGIFKETDVGKWVHLVCALYVPGVAFGEVDHLSSVTLFEMPYSKWGAKTCSLCEDVRFARCGVCIGCDAGMCKTYFHVTCAQAAGLLQPFEAHSEEADHADPFYAHCKIHSDKTLIKHRKRNYDAFRLKMSYRNANIEQLKLQSSPEQKRIERKLKKHRNKYISNKTIKNEPWVPTQKMPRLLSTSASACRRLLAKAELMGIDVAALEFQEAQIASLNDVRKKWHIPPAFSVEFIGYYLDRISRSTEVKKNLQEQIELNKTLVNEQQSLREQYDECIAVREEHTSKKTKLIERIEKLHSAIWALCPNKTLTSVDNITTKQVETASTVLPISKPISVPTAAALKMGVGFPLTISGANDLSNRVLSTQCPNKSDLLYECGICKRVNDQHLLAKCDTCRLHYHLGCLNPPLTRHPKKSKIYGWQCSECDEDNPEGVVQLTEGPRKSRTKYSKDGTIVPVDSSRDVSMDESGADDDKINVQFDKKETPKSPPNSTRTTPAKNTTIPVKSPPTPSPTKKPTSANNKKCDKNLSTDKIPAKRAKMNDGIVSPLHSTSFDGINNKTAIGTNSPSPTKLKMSFTSSANLDKVIEAVSKGLITGNHESSTIEIKESRVELSPLRMPLVNGIQNNLNDTKVLTPPPPPPPQQKSTPPSPPIVEVKTKASKKVKKEKAKEKEKVAEKDVENEKEKEKPKDTEKAKDKEKEKEKEKDSKEKNKLREKLKRKTKVTPAAAAAAAPTSSPPPLPSVAAGTAENSSSSPQSMTVQNFKDEKFKSNEKDGIEAMSPHNDTAPKSGHNKIIGNSPERPEAATTIDSTNTNAVSNGSKDTKSISENSLNGEIVNVLNNSSEGTVEAMATSTTATTAAVDQMSSVDRKQNRKHRKEKHRNKHGPDTERSSSKEHKKKRKRKNHDHENTDSFPPAGSVPTIKIKFKALPLPGETAAESHFFYVPANMVRPLQVKPREIRNKTRPASINSIDDVTTSTPFTIKTPPPTEPMTMNSPPKVSDKTRTAVSPPVRTRRTSSLLSPPKLNARLTSSTPVNVNMNDTKDDVHICFVCQVSGTAQDLVKCDECKKSYHFQCLEPPLRKTPKRRGYSWHCADCDPTDKEDN